MKRTWKRILSFASVAKGLIGFVILPTLVVAGYYVFVATPIYVSESHFTVRSQSGGSVAPSMLSSFIGSMGDSVAAQDIAIVSNYIQSRDILEKLNQEVALRDHYSDPSIDLWARMPTDISEEGFLEYYQGKLEILLDDTTGIISLKTKAFDALTAKAIADRILVHSEALVNALSLQMTQDRVKFAEQQMALAEQRLRDAAVKLTEYRNLTKILDPTEKTGAVLGIITALESNLAEARATRGQLLSYQREDSAEIRTINARIKALEDQIEKENLRLTGKEKVELSEILETYEQLSLEKEIAHQLYSSTLASLEAARDEASRKQLYLMTFVRPSLPESAVEPSATWNTFTVLMLALLCYVLASLILSTIKDHMGY